MREEFPVGCPVLIRAGRKIQRGKVVGLTYSYSSAYRDRRVVVEVDGVTKRYLPNALRKIRTTQSETTEGGVAGE